MKWFKHSVDSHDDPDISDAEDLFKDAGYVIFFKIKELYAREYNHTNDEGWLHLSEGFVKRKLRKSVTKVSRVLNFYEKRKRIYFQKCNGGYLIKIPNFIDIMDNWSRRETIKTTELLQSNDVETTQRRRIKNKEVRSKKKETTFVENSVEFSLSKKLLNLILGNNPNFKKPDLQKWAIEIEKAIRLDKRTPEQLERVIEWSQQDDFWKQNILSTQKLRKQFDQLFMKMGVEKNAESNRTSTKNARAKEKSLEDQRAKEARAHFFNGLINDRSPPKEIYENVWLTDRQKEFLEKNNLQVFYEKLSNTKKKYPNLELFNNSDSKILINKGLREQLE